MERKQRTRVAVLGGGPTSLSTVLWLTSTPELRARYEVTVYQMGWRLGGKGASGRGEYGRIEEHGLHVLFGFYQNFFHAIRTVYGELNRPPGHPLRTWRQAFHPRDLGVEEEWVLGAWDPWMVAFPANGAVPGSQGALLTLPQYLWMMLQGLVTLLFGWKAGYRFTSRLHPRGRAWEEAPDPPLGGDDPWGARLLFDLWLASMRGATYAVRFLRRARWLVGLYEFLRRTAWHGIKRLAARNRRAHRIWLDLDALLAMGTGILVDELFLRDGFAAVDDEDFRAWLVRHGVHHETLSTTLVRTIYDAAFSYENGDPDRQRVSAGSTVRVLTRWALTYKGAAFYRMHAGMGDVVFAPIYEVLKRRGVRFEFFHKVEALHLSEDGRSIGGITVNRQARVKPEVGEYDPLVMIKGLESWPAQPRYEQLVDAERLKGIDLESYYSGYVGERIELKQGEDFDVVVFGIPIGAVRFLCRELMDNPRTPQWARMVEHVKSVQTESAQLWFTEDLHALGWRDPEPLLSLFVEPYNTWADMSQVLPFEDWKGGVEARDVGYFTGAQIGPTDPPLPEEDPTFEERMTESARKDLFGFCECRDTGPEGQGIGGVTTLLPNAMDANDPPCLDWSLLVDPQERKGRDRLNWQFWKSNCGPSERCTISLPGTNQYRMRADGTGYDNLFITGDWIDNDLYIAFMEASFQSGIHTARAVSGEAFPIIGEWLNRL